MNQWMQMVFPGHFQKFGIFSLYFTFSSHFVMAVPKKRACCSVAQLEVISTFTKQRRQVATFVVLLIFIFWIRFCHKHILLDVILCHCGRRRMIVEVSSLFMSCNFLSRVTLSRADSRVTNILAPATSASLREFHQSENTLAKSSHSQEEGFSQKEVLPHSEIITNYLRV